MQNTTKRGMPGRPTTETGANPEFVLGVNQDIDWSPESVHNHPRTLTVKQGRFLVYVEEALIEKERGSHSTLIVGVGDGTTSTLCNLICEELTPADLDSFIAILTVARDKARALNMPSDKQSGGGLRQ